MSHFNYQLDTNIGRVRLLIGDTSEDEPIFWDEEINTFLSLTGDNLREAAALAYETWARDRAKLDLMMRQQGISSQREASSQLLQLAQAIRASVLGAGGGIAVASMTANGDYYKNVRPLGSIKQDPLKEFYP